MNIPFAGNILIIGNGAVSKCLQILLLKNVSLDFRKCIVIDQLNFKPSEVPLVAQAGGRFFQESITQHNYNTVLKKYLKQGDLLIDLGFCIETLDLLKWCRYHHVLFLNSSIENWPTNNESSINSQSHSLYSKYWALHSQSQLWDKTSPTTIVDHGANPGLVNHWVKYGMHNLARRFIEENPAKSRSFQLIEALDDRDYARLAMLLGIKTIHISERDGQVLDSPKPVDTFYNTWSIPAFFEECIAPSEIAWGTHEHALPQNAAFHQYGPNHILFLDTRAINVIAQSWVPSGPVAGIVVRHGEVYSLGYFLTYNENHNLVHRPTIFYVYCPNDPAYQSLLEVKTNDYQLHDYQQVITNQIASGVDELGIVLLDHYSKGLWVGSELSINEARIIAPEQNATTVQVAVGVLGALYWLFENQDSGFLFPDQIPHDYIIEKTKPFLGIFSTRTIDWNPIQYKRESNRDSKWQFEDFLINPEKKNDF